MSNLPPILDRIVRWRDFLISARQAQDKIDAEKRAQAQNELDRLVVANQIEKMVHEDYVKIQGEKHG